VEWRPDRKFFDGGNPIALRGYLPARG